MRRIACRVALVGVLVSLGAAPVWAEDSASVSADDHVLVAHNGSLFLVGRITNETVETVEIVRMDENLDDDPIARLEVRGTTLLIEKRANIAWARIGSTPAQSLIGMRSLPCRAPARLSGTGDWMSCTSQGGQIEFYDLRLLSPRRVVLPETREYSLSLELLSEDVAVGVDPSGLWSIPLQGRTKGQPGALLFAGVPDGEMLVAPNGKRAVAPFNLAKLDRGVALYTFRLDGKSSRRRLMKGAVPVAWSADSQWLLVQRGSRACVVGVNGGQYKCWRGYTAVAIDSTGAMLLLSRSSDAADDAQSDEDTNRGSEGIVPARDEDDAPRDAASHSPIGASRLYTVRTAGAQSEAPRLLFEQADGPAAWVETRGNGTDFRLQSYQSPQSR